MTLDSKKRLRWRLRILMVEQNIYSATQLQKLLGKSGYDITSSQLTRIIKDRPERISTDLLDHLLEIFNCEIGDLLRNSPYEKELEDGSGYPPDESSPRPKTVRIRRKISTAEHENITGPKVSPFPIPEVRK